jgi:hypothetical protein
MRNYIFEIHMNEFEKVVNAVQKINCIDISNGLDVIGKDGATCEIEVAGLGSGITYKVWSPTYHTQKRNLQQFLDACKLILQTAKLSPEEIL